MTTLTEENYIKAIFHLGLNGTKSVSTNAIAAHLEMKASSVTDMIKKLDEKQYVVYKKYKGVTLTNTGQQLARLIVRKHRLWEVFLVNHMNFSWDEVHDVAEQLEHIKSDKLVDELDAFLGFPSHDPHGDPIPNKAGDIKVISKILLSDAQVDSPCICVGVKDSSKSFLTYLDKNNIGIGANINISAVEPFDNSLVITLNGKSMVVSQLVAQNIYVQLVL